MQNGSSVPCFGGVQCTGSVQSETGAACNAMRACKVKWGQRARLQARAKQNESSSVQCSRGRAKRNGSGVQCTRGGVQSEMRAACRALHVCKVGRKGRAKQNEGNVQCWGGEGGCAMHKGRAKQKGSGVQCFGGVQCTRGRMQSEVRAMCKAAESCKESGVHHSGVQSAVGEVCNAQG